MLIPTWAIIIAVIILIIIIVLLAIDVAQLNKLANDPLSVSSSSISSLSTFNLVMLIIFVIIIVIFIIYALYRYGIFSGVSVVPSVAVAPATAQVYETPVNVSVPAVERRTIVTPPVRIVEQQVTPSPLAALSSPVLSPPVVSSQSVYIT